MKRRHSSLHTEQLEPRMVLSANMPCCPEPEQPVPFVEFPAVPETIQVGEELPSQEIGGLFDDVEYFGGQREWNLNAIQAPEVWAAGFTGQDVTVAVIDTGVDFLQADLVDNIWQNVGEIAGDGLDNDGNGFVDDYLGWDFVDADNTPHDSQGHGTHVAGTIAADLNGLGATGVAHDATIMPIRVLGDEGFGSTYDVAAGIRYAVDNGADIINLSLGGSGYSSSIYAALDYAQANDVFVAAAAGNEGQATAAYPAAHSGQLTNVLSVGAYNSSSQLAGFSNGAAGHVVQIDAPGVNIFSTLPGNQYGSYSGTSMAAPHIAGAAALVLSADPSLTSADLRNALIAGANQSIAGSNAQGGVNTNISVSAAAVGNVDQLLADPVLVNQQPLTGTLPLDSGSSVVTAGFDVVLDDDELASLSGEVQVQVIDRIAFETSEIIAVTRLSQPPLVNANATGPQLYSNVGTRRLADSEATESEGSHNQATESGLFAEWYVKA